MGKEQFENTTTQALLDMGKSATASTRALFRIAKELERLNNTLDKMRAECSPEPTTTDEEGEPVMVHSYAWMRDL